MESSSTKRITLFNNGGEQEYCVWYSSEYVCPVTLTDVEVPYEGTITFVDNVMLGAVPEEILAIYPNFQTPCCRARWTIKGGNYEYADGSNFNFRPSKIEIPATRYFKATSWASPSIVFRGGVGTSPMPQNQQTVIPTVTTE